MDVEIRNWVLDNGISREREPKYLKTVDLYWHIKTFMGKMLLDSEENGEILEQLVEVRQ